MLIEVSANTLSLPRLCACCANDPDTEIPLVATRTSGKRVIKTQSRTWRFPFCRDCLHHVERWQAASTHAIVLAVLALVCALAGFSTPAFWVGTVLNFCAAVGVLLWGRSKARALCSPACSSAELSIAYLGWRGTVQVFDIRSPQFAAAFASNNRRKLINVDAEVRATLEAVREVEVVLPKLEPVRPPPVPRAADPGDTYVKWVSKIESLKGPAARRAALERALLEVVNPADQAKLKTEVARIEVRAALDRADSLKTVPAKRRAIQEAIDYVRRDSVPDELQAEEIGLLTVALRELDGP
jgi:hypothetical protein